MRRVLMTVSATALTATGAFAGGIERSTQSVAILFEQGNYVEFSLGSVSPDVSGVQQVPLTTPAGNSSGDMAGDYTTWSLAVKTALTDKLDFALILDEPIGADVDYATGTGYSYAGSTATIDSHALTGLLRYKATPSFSVIGGLRAVQTEGEVSLFNGYDMKSKKETDFGYVLGVAWEKPEIAARVALTYNSAIDHDFRVQESVSFGALVQQNEFTTTIPQSLLLEAQTGIAADTLLFGSVRWVDWSEFKIAPPLYTQAFLDNLVDYDGDTVTYSIGLGRKFNDTWSGAITASYEDAIGGFSGNLGPTDGATSVGLATTYTRGPMKITGGVRYIWLGDTETEATQLAYPAGTTFGDFKDNEGVALGFRVGYSF
ncbi:outer membrane protein transport protein [Frigidibacter sp.]|uniref:outer membrane protein transport protein n=1 Tax=Frigidibacter sp. TaxID=2586418 RepID=UPI00273681D0|nr:outer membrane protein transport protein [Frigidibacter sp.]MDP3342664.1 outer membrane protein transport protein [Frigidibacter sp.]